MSGWFLRNRDVGYGCLTGLSHINNQGTVQPLYLFLLNCWSDVSFMPTAGPHQRLLLMLFSCSSVGCLLIPPVLACWMPYVANMAAAMNHQGTTMGSHRAGVACALILLVSLAKHSASSVLCCPYTSSSGGEVCLTMGLVAGGGCAGAVGCLSLGFSASPNHTLDPPQSGGWPCLLLVLEPLRSTSSSASSNFTRMASARSLGRLVANRLALAQTWAPIGQELPAH